VSVRFKRLSLSICLLVLISSSFGIARSTISDSARVAPVTSAASGLAYCTATHDVGKMGLLMTNGGMIGIDRYSHKSGSGWQYIITPTNYSPTPYTPDSSGCHLGGVVDGSQFYGGEYPLGTRDKCLQYAALWVGGITPAGDTLVSVGLDPDRSDGVNFEFYPDVRPMGNIESRSLLSPNTALEARSDQDYVAVYTDTFTSNLSGLLTDWKTHRRHQPLGIKVTQTSCQWSNLLVNDFVIIEYKIENIGRQNLSQVFAGLYFSPDVGHYNFETEKTWNDGNTVGLLSTYPSDQGCGFIDTLSVAWGSTCGGTPKENYEWVTSGPEKSDRSIFGVRLLQAPKEADQLSYNWWMYWWSYNPVMDYGPRHRPPLGEEPYDFGTGGTGTPAGDASKYYVMSNRELDVDNGRVYQIAPSDPVWEYPSDWARLISGTAGADCLLSVGPFDLRRGEEKSIVFALVGGENFHQSSEDAALGADEWYQSVDFSDLAKNAKMAEWVFDNPGVDTDGDGDAGKFRVCVLDSAFVNGHWSPTAAETTYYAGDGVPDWRAVGPPPAPKFWLTPSYRGITVRFNGKNSETTKDLVTNKIDFEGYRIYCGLDEREASLATVASYDRQDYDKYVFDPKTYPYGAWEAKDYPFTLERLKCLYGFGNDPCHDSIFDPLRYTQGYPLKLARIPDSLFYFVPHDYNASELGKTSPIRKIYPDAKLPAPDSITEEDLTPDGYLKYYEYEFEITNLLPTMQYFVNVTAFDFGDPAKGVDPLESSRTLGMQTGYPLADLNQLGDVLPPVYEYPNPYFGDGRYRANGYEGRTSDASDDRVRKIHFVNVPAKCTVRVLTLDGDLVTEIHHDKNPSDANAHHESWDMISRNHETIVSGLYYWAVEGADGKVQIGKFVIIR
jgi:hypothetical protein